MRKWTYILLFTLLAGTQLKGQDIVQQALMHLQNNELESAKDLVDKAIQLDLYNQKATTWFYYGYVYKELYKANDIGNINSTNLEKASNAYLKALEMDNNHPEKNNNILGINYLAIQYYNIAGTILNQATFNVNIDTNIINKAITNYARYKELKKISEPNFDNTERDISFYYQLGSAYHLKYDSSKFTDKKSGKYAEIYFGKVLELDNNNVSALYNVGIIYYNEAVDIINTLDYDEDLEKLNKSLDYSIELFLKALPYMKKAYELEPKRKETIVGLSYIYLSLNDNEKSEQFKRELKMLEENE